MPLNVQRARAMLQGFEFQTLFIEELGWSWPPSRQAAATTLRGVDYSRTPVAQLAGVVAYEIGAPDGRIPDARTRADIQKAVAAQVHEHLLIFTDATRTQSLWYWVKRERGKSFPRDHLFVKGQPGDLFLSKLAGLVFEIGDFREDGSMDIMEVTSRLRSALDIQQVTRKFYTHFQEQHDLFLGRIEGIDDENDRRWYASVILNRLMFIWFLQRKLFLDNGNAEYLPAKLAESKERGPDRYYREFLCLLFFEGFAKPEAKRSSAARQRLGAIRYLNGGLFLPHPVEQRWGERIQIPDDAFAELFALFARYSWNLNDEIGGLDDEISPDVLGYIFEKYINQKAFGAYYTRPEITEYLCERTIHGLVLAAVNSPGIPGVLPGRHFDTVADLVLSLDAHLCRRLVSDVLPNLKLLDPACGSGAFLVAAMKTLIDLYAAVVGRIKFLNDRGLTEWLAKAEREHPSLNYFIKKRIITDNLFGVDIMPEGAEIARLRLFLALVASANTAADLEPLPNIDFNILTGNSLVGLLRVDDKAFENRTASLFRPSYRAVLAEKNRLIRLYRQAEGYAEHLTELRDQIRTRRTEDAATLNDILLDEFSHLSIRFEQATWDDTLNAQGKPKKRALTLADIEALTPFHWGYEFDEVLNARGGFDAIITNPPWEVLQADEKEFFQRYDGTVRKKRIDIKEWRKRLAEFMQDRELRQAWLDYASGFGHLSAWLRNGPQYRCLEKGKINLYAVFIEQCFNLLRDGGRCGIIVPSGIYTDLGTSQLRGMLFGHCAVDTLFGLSNEKFIFENVHHAFKFCILSFAKGGSTGRFGAAFRVNPRESVRPEQLERFLHSPAEHLLLDAAFVRKLSPDSLSVMEFRGEPDVQIAEKMLRFEALHASAGAEWGIRLQQGDFNMTSDSDLFRPERRHGCMPLVQGGMIHQFDHAFGDPKYWVPSDQGRLRILGRNTDTGETLPYQAFRFVHRRIAAATNERTAIACVMPPGRFCADTAQSTRCILRSDDLLFLTACFNSFVADWEVRQRVTQHMDMHFVYRMRIPRLTSADTAFRPIVERAARLVCTTPEFDDLAREIFGKQATAASVGATAFAERAQLRAELDGLVAHLYGLTEDEFAHILSTFPLVPDPAKVAAHNAYRDAARGALP